MGARLTGGEWPMAPEPAAIPSAWDSRRTAEWAVGKNKEAEMYLRRVGRAIRAASEKGQHQAEVGVPRARLEDTKKNRDFMSGVVEVLKGEGYSAKFKFKPKKNGSRDWEWDFRGHLFDEVGAELKDVQSAKLEVSWQMADPNRPY